MRNFEDLTARGGSEHGASVLPAHPRRLLFGPFSLDIHDEKLWRDDRPLSLRPLTFALLRYLASDPQRLVTKRELLDTLWPDVHVGDAVLKTQIKELRKVLGDTLKTPKFVETVHRRGYRFIASVQAEPSQSELEPTTRTLHPPVRLASAQQLSVLSQSLARVLSGERRFVLVTGEPGTGKTALVRSFLSSLDACDGLAVTWGQCSEQLAPSEAYRPILEALCRCCLSSHGKHLTEALQRMAPAWFFRMPALFDWRRTPPPDWALTQTACARMPRELADALQLLTARQALLLQIEDLQWADPPTLDLIGYLCSRLDLTRLMIVATCRSAARRDLEHPTRRLQRRLQLQSSCDEISLDALREQESAESSRAPTRQRLVDSQSRIAHRILTPGSSERDMHPLHILTDQEIRESEA